MKGNFGVFQIDLAIIRNDYLHNRQNFYYQGLNYYLRDYKFEDRK